MNASWKDQLTAFNGNTITYDAIGNPLTYDGATYTWQGRRLMGYTEIGTTVSYQYNADGIRTAKVVNGFRTEYYLNGSQIIREVIYSSNGAYISTDLRYSYDGEGNPCSIHYYTYDGAGNVTNDVIYLLTTNTQGDVTGIYSSNGNLLYTYLYDAWGNLIHESEHADSGEEAAAVNPFRYRGYYFDTETGLYYLNSRYYNPQWGRFLNADDVGIVIATPGGLTDKNLYAYCDNNPVMRTDDGGAFWETVFDIVSLGFSIAEVIANPNDPWAWAGLAGDALDLIPFVTGVGEVTRIVKAVDKIADVVDTSYDIAKTANRVEDVVDMSTKGIRYTDKVIKQMENAADLHHSFPSVIDTLVDINSGRLIKGGDDVMRTIIELPGSINRTPGIFEYIIEPNGMCNHRYFKELKPFK